jgi:hypothetical protein
VSAPHEDVLQIDRFTSFFLKFKSHLLVKKIFLLNAAFAAAVLGLISRTVSILHDLFTGYPDI